MRDVRIQSFTKSRFPCSWPIFPETSVFCVLSCLFASLLAPICHSLSLLSFYAVLCLHSHRQYHSINRFIFQQKIRTADCANRHRHRQPLHTIAMLCCATVLHFAPHCLCQSLELPYRLSLSHFCTLNYLLLHLADCT